MREKKKISRSCRPELGILWDMALPSITGFLWDIFKQIPVNPPSEAKLGESMELSSGRGERSQLSDLAASTMGVKIIPGL